MSRLDQLRVFPIFETLNDQELLEIGPLFTEKRLARRTTVISAKEQSSFVLFIVSGEIKISRTGEDGREITVATLGRGEFFGELALLSDDQRSANAETLSECFLLIIQSAPFFRLIREHPSFSEALLRTLAQRLRQATENMAELALRSVPQRLLSVLKRLADRNGSDSGEKTLVRPSQQELANMIGSSREMVTRALKELEAQGEIVANQRIITLKS